MGRAHVIMVLNSNWAIEKVILERSELLIELRAKYMHAFEICTVTVNSQCRFL